MGLQAVELLEASLRVAGPTPELQVGLQKLLTVAQRLNA